MKTYVFRLTPGMDLRKEIDVFVAKKKIKAGYIATCVGNVTKAVLRMAGGKIINEYKGSFEIVSLVGTVESGNGHLHISLADNDAKLIGGHLKEGTIVGVTAEVVIVALDNMSFTRVFDKNTGYDELVVKK